MHAAGRELESDPTLEAGRRLRVVAVIAASTIAIASTAILFLWGPGNGSESRPIAPSARTAYRIGTVDFVDRREGWVVGEYGSDGADVLHTRDGGMSWSRQLSMPKGGSSHYLKFFDRANGVFGSLGSNPVLERTEDGGQSWKLQAALREGATALSWSFIDSRHGWMLAIPESGRPASLYRTGDAGESWANLGSLVSPPDQAFAIAFSSATTGWLASAGSGPYAYRTDDGGLSWSRIPLPSRLGLPAAGRFFVDVQPTARDGAIASVVAFSEFRGPIGKTGMIRRFPPLAVPFYDGSRPNNYVYQTLINQVIDGPYANVQAPRSELLSSVDGGSSWSVTEPPSITGAIGFADASHWWWINTGVGSSSSDGGRTWTSVHKVGIIEPMPGTLDVLDRAHAWFSGLSASALQATDDGGLHWRLVALPPVEAIQRAQTSGADSCRSYMQVCGRHFGNH